VATIVGILVAIAIPGLLSSKNQANEAAALKDLRAAQSEMEGRPIDCQHVPPYILGTKSGYVRGCSPGKYWARPEVQGQTGVRGFAADSTGRLCFTTDGSIPNMSGNCEMIR
jgi:type II secretory pathway pseudopilin PulG